MTTLSGAAGAAGALVLRARAWRFLDSGAADGATNMAWDLALLDHARATGEATFRVYGWSHPTLSFGRHERARGRFDPARLATQGVDAVRRPTGGRALLHHREVTYAVAAPVDALSLAESYRAINAVLIAALGRLAVEAREAPRRGAPTRPGNATCFAEPNAGELVTDAGKLVGSAQWREDGAFLQHGSILLADDQAAIGPLLFLEGPAPVPPRVATLEHALRRPVAYGEVRDALRSALAHACAGWGVTSPAVIESDPGMLGTADRYRDHFRDAAWTWRR